MKNEIINLTEKVKTIPYDDKRIFAGIKCQTCGNSMDLLRGRFPICDDCLKDLREIIKERRLEKEKAELERK